MQVDLDKFELYYLLEACFRGSHLRSGTILKFVNTFYHKMNDKQRLFMYEYILRDIYGNDFKPISACCGVDIVFMARFNPDNRYIVEMSDGNKYDCFMMNGRYHVTDTRFCDEKHIRKVIKKED